MPQLLSIDWLSLYVHCPQLGLSTSFKELDLPYGTRQYSRITEYYYNNERIATLCHQPCSSILKKGTGILKFDNSIFYKAGYLRFIHYLLAEYHYEVINISRVDLCCDFQYFTNDLEPQKLIKMFMHNQLWKIGNSKFQSIGNQNERLNYEYLRFGKNSSACVSYLYNKSKEMKDVKVKNYIVDKWKEVKFQQNRDVWRLEFSLKGNVVKIATDDEVGYRDVELRDLVNYDNLVSLYATLSNKYFEFRINDGQKRKDRMEALQLFDFEPSNYNIYIADKHNETTRADKIFVTKVDKVFAELRDNEQINSEEIEKFILKFIEITGLEKWFIEKHIDSQLFRSVYLQYQRDNVTKQPFSATPV